MKRIDFDIICVIYLNNYFLHSIMLPSPISLDGESRVREKFFQSLVISFSEDPLACIPLPLSFQSLSSSSFCFSTGTFFLKASVKSLRVMIPTILVPNYSITTKWRKLSFLKRSKARCTSRLSGIVGGVSNINALMSKNSLAYSSARFLMI